MGSGAFLFLLLHKYHCVVVVVVLLLLLLLSTFWNNIEVKVHNCCWDEERKGENAEETLNDRLQHQLENEKLEHNQESNKNNVNDSNGIFYVQ